MRKRHILVVRDTHFKTVSANLIVAPTAAMATAMTTAMAIAMTTDIVIGAGSPALKDSPCRMESVSPIEALTIASHVREL